MRKFQERLKQQYLITFPPPLKAAIPAENKKAEDAPVEQNGQAVQSPGDNPDPPASEDGNTTDPKTPPPSKLVVAKAPAPTPTPTPAPVSKRPFRPIRVLGRLDSFGKQQTGARPSASGERLSTFASHRWLECVDQFADRISNVWSRSNAGRDRGSIVVALIDDGVDTTHGPLAGKVLTGRTFGYDMDRVRPWYVSEAGHGTLMASMIVRVCPMAKVYPIRLNTIGSKALIDTNSAIQVRVSYIQTELPLVFRWKCVLHRIGMRC